MIQSVKVDSALERTVVEVLSSRSVAYTAFKLTDPPRVVLDIEGKPGKDLPVETSIYNGNIRDIVFEPVKDQPSLTRMTIGLVLPLEHDIQAKDDALTVALFPKSAATAGPAGSTPPQGEEEASFKPNEPRIFFDAKKSELNQILGVDFTMLAHGKSRITVTTDKKATYDLDRKGSHTRVLKLRNAAPFPSTLLRELDSSEFQGVLERIRPGYSPSDKQATIAILMREMVPYHVDQKAQSIYIDFGPTSVKPSGRSIVPLKLAHTPGAGALTPAAGSPPPAMIRKSPEPHVGLHKRYTGAPMTMDFVNADVTNILRLLGEISNLNVVWGPEVKGTVSMRLKNVPWDQALDLVLANNNLAKREDGNVIWVTTKAQLTAVEAEERRRREDREREFEENLKKTRGEEMRTAYLTVNYKDVNNIRDIIEKTVKSDSGKITVDPQTKTIIYYDRISKIQEANSLKEKLDQATPQVMIEARIIEADSTFSRNLGVQWASTQAQFRSNTNTTWAGAPPWAVDNAPASFPPGGRLYNPTFSTGFSSVVFPKETLGLTFTKLLSNGLTGIHLDAALLLAEAEGKSRTLSAPKIVTRDTVKATIQQGTKIVIPAGTDANGNKTYQQVDASLKLEVKPQITPNNMVIMEVVVKDDQPDYTNAMGENVPIKTKEATTTMMVGSGDTVVIGGIYKEADTENEEGIPGLRKIPLLGWLFKAQGITSRKVELLIFLTPTVLTT
jgi:type IV pilus assembly protein PilQ